MTVAEAIKLLQDEDPNAKLVIILSRYRHKSLRQLREMDEGLFDDVRFDGIDRDGMHTPALVLIANRDLD